MSSKRINFLNLEQKIEVVKRKEQNPKLGERKLTEEFNCSKTQINNTLKRKEEVLKEFENNNNKSRKRIKSLLKNHDINEVTYEWFCKARVKGIPISGPILQSKAKMFAEALGNDSFHASNGWLESFRKRNICYNVLSSEGRV
jgi:hypothetical protein